MNFNESNVAPVVGCFSAIGVREDLLQAYVDCFQRDMLYL
jgi:hypothetical protein